MLYLVENFDQLTRTIMNEKLHNTIRPILENPVPIKEQKMLLNKMFTLAITNAPDDETDNFTAKSLTPVFLALSEVLESASEI